MIFEVIRVVLAVAFIVAVYKLAAEFLIRRSIKQAERWDDLEFVELAEAVKEAKDTEVLAGIPEEEVIGEWRPIAVSGLKTHAAKMAENSREVWITACGRPLVGGDVVVGPTPEDCCGRCNRSVPVSELV